MRLNRKILLIPNNRPKGGNMNNEKSKQKIYEELWSNDMGRRIKAIRLLPKLNSGEAFQVIEEILKKIGDLGMKLEAIRILPQMVTQETYKDVSRLLQIAIGNKDLEVVRNVLFILQKIPPNYINKFLIASVIKKLHSEDSDIKYHAINSLVHLSSQISYEELQNLILPITKHPNKVLQGKANKVLHELSKKKN